MTLIFKRTGCDTIVIPDASARDVVSYIKTVENCATITHDLERFELHSDYTKVEIWKK